MALRNQITVAVEANRHDTLAKRIQLLEQQLADYQLREQDLRLILENSPEKIIALDTSLHVVVVSQAFKAFCREVFQREPQLETDFLALLNKKAKAFWETRLKKALRGERQVAQTSQIVEGQTLILEVTFHPVWRGQQVHFVLVLCRDVTAQHRAEAEVREHAVNLSNALRIASAGSWEYHISSQMITISEEALSVLGIQDRSELVVSLEEFIRQFLHPGDVALLQERLEHALAHQDDPAFRDRFEYRLLDIHGNVRQLIVHSRYKSNAKGVIYGVTQDITEQKAMLSQLQAQNAQLKKVNSELDNFVYSVSHDLRAPLTSILGLVNVMRLEEDPTQLQAYLDLQEKSVQKLDSFIRDIIDLSRNARLAPHYDTVDMETVIREVFAQQSYDTKAKRIERKTHIQASAPIVTDRRRLMIILNNLVSNAIRYADFEKPHPCVKVEVKADARHITLHVLDNGIGVENQHLTRIYDMFFRASETRSGSGLGLYIVKETVDRLGGTIRVESKLGKGTHFTVSLPNHGSA